MLFIGFLADTIKKQTVLYFILFKTVQLLQKHMIPLSIKLDSNEE